MTNAELLQALIRVLEEAGKLAPPSPESTCRVPWKPLTPDPDYFTRPSGLITSLHHSKGGT